MSHICDQYYLSGSPNQQLSGALKLKFHLFCCIYCTGVFNLPMHTRMMYVQQLPLSSYIEANLPNVAKNVSAANINALHLPLTKGHLSNVATIFWQIGWPY